MIATCSRVEEPVVSTVPVADAIVFVLAGMRVHDIAQHVQPVLVGLIDQRLELIRGPTAAAGSEEVGHVVPE